jgi:hypothetical protein
LALASLHMFQELYPQIASLIGIAAGSAINYSVNRYAVFRRFAPLDASRLPDAGIVRRFRSHS